MDAVAVAMTPDNHVLAVRIAELPDIVRGYEDVKLANVVRYRKQGEQLISELMMQAPQLSPATSYFDLPPKRGVHTSVVALENDDISHVFPARGTSEFGDSQST
jgi:hypothetical protein